MSVPTPILQYTLSDATMKGLLPAGYTPLAYIESTGTQYIDTGLQLSTFRIEFVAQILSRVGNEFSLISCWSDSNQFFNLYTNDNSSIKFYSGTSTTISTDWSKHTYIINRPDSSNFQVYVDSVQKISSTSSATSSAVSIKISRRGDGNASYSNGSGRFFEVKIWNNQLSADLRPAKRDSDGVIGMYDLVSRTFKTNSGSGSFIAGPPLAVGKGGGKSLPEEYQQVEWLQGTGTQWIDTQVTCGTTDVVNTAWTLDSTEANGEWQGINGQMQLSVNNGSVTDGANTISISKLTNVEYNYNNGNSTLKVGSTSYTRSWGQRDAQPIYLWKLSNYSGSLNNCKISKFYATKAGSVVRNMYACYRKSDGKPGMYDTVNGVFYTNAGSGEFILGPSITNCYTSEPNAGSGTQQGLYTNVSSAYDSSKRWVADFSNNTTHLSTTISAVGNTFSVDALGNISV